MNFMPGKMSFADYFGFDQGTDEGPPRLLADVQHGGHRDRHERGVRDRGQLNEPDAIRKVIDK